MMVASPTKRMHIGRTVGRIPARWGAGDPPCRSTSCSPVVAGAICARRPTWRGRRSAAGAATPRCRSPGRSPRGDRSLGLFAGVRDVFRAEVLLAILLGALVVSCTLAIPVVGGVAGLALLAAAAVVYREVIRLSGLQGAPEPQEPAWRVWPVRCAWGLVIALGLTAPVLLRHGIMDSYGRLIPLRGAGVAAAAALGWIAVPLVVLIGSACDRSGPLTVRAALAVVGRHPYRHDRGPADRPGRPGVPRSRPGDDHRPAGVVRVPRARPLPRQEIRLAPLPRSPPLRHPIPRARLLPANSSAPTPTACGWATP